MVIYEVNIQINVDIQNRFSSWLRSHAKQMLEFDGFKKYNIYKNEKEYLSFSVHYHVESIIYLENYIRNHSDGMRLKGKKEFENKMTINRRILSKL